jgi:general secretion pathway protein M
LTQLSLRERRLVAVALLAALLAMVLYAIILPVINGFSDRAAERAALIATFERDERAVVQIDSIRRAAEAQRRDAARYHLQGGSAAVAADLLKERVAAAITASGGDLRAVDDVAAAAGTLQVRADARLTTSQLTAVLASLQAGEPLLVVEKLSVAATQAFQTGRSGPMDVQIETSGSYSTPAPR